MKFIFNDYIRNKNQIFIKIIAKDKKNMDAFTVTKNELIIFLQKNKFEHLSRSEQTRLRDYLEQMLITLQGAADLQRMRRTGSVMDAT